MLICSGCCEVEEEEGVIEEEGVVEGCSVALVGVVMPNKFLRAGLDGVAIFWGLEAAGGD